MSDTNAPATKDDIAQHEARELQAMKTGLSYETLKIAAVVVVAILGTVFGAWRVLLSEARAQTDAGVAVVAQKSEATQRELERFQQEVGARFERLEKAGQRADEKLDAVLLALKVPNPAPAPAKDGGP